MGTKIRVDGEWVDLELNDAISPNNLTGTWLSNVSNSNRQHNTSYLNNTGKLIYVSATFRVDSAQTGSGWGSALHRDSAGTSARAYVSDPNTSNTNPYSWNNICRVRDNGTNQANILFLNLRFFVPPNCYYIAKFYNTNDSEHNYNPSQNNNLTKFATVNWNEFEIDLAFPNHTFTSLDSNSNNFQRSGKAPSTAITNPSNTATGWSDFMEEFAVWHEPGNIGTLSQAYSTTYTINITKAGDYKLEYGIDDFGSITFDGTQVASVANNSSSWASDPPLTVVIQNITVGIHTIGVSVTNDPNSNLWDNNPAGIAWRLKPFGT